VSQTIIALGIQEVAEEFQYQVFKVNPVSQSYQLLTSFPKNLYPAMQGASFAFDPMNRILVIPMKNSSSSEYLLSIFNVDTLQLQLVSQPVYYTQLLELNVNTSFFYALVTPTASDPNNPSISWGYIDNLTWEIRPVEEWNESQFVQIVNGLSTLDASTETIYAIATDSFGPPDALITVDTLTGSITAGSYFDNGAPSFIAFVPNS